MREYLALSRMAPASLSAYRHPIVMFGIGPAYLFLLRHRLPVGYMRKGWQPWISTMATNAATAVIITGMIWLVGAGPFLLVHLPVMLLAASMGVWLFYVQHQFEETSWAEDPAWNMHEAALHGSSHYDLPPVLRWFTANIGVHHVHHLCSRIPFYRLPEVLRDHPELNETSRLTILESLHSVRLVLWDEERQQLISFKDLRGHNSLMKVRASRTVSLQSDREPHCTVPRRVSPCTHDQQIVRAVWWSPWLARGFDDFEERRGRESRVREDRFRDRELLCRGTE